MSIVKKTCFHPVSDTGLVQVVILSGIILMWVISTSNFTNNNEMCTLKFEHQK